MTARILLIVFDAVYLIALTAWVGSILFFSFGVAPIIFKVLSPRRRRGSSGPCSRAITPWGATAGRSPCRRSSGGPLSYPECRGRWVGGPGARDPGRHAGDALLRQLADPGDQRRPRRRARRPPGSSDCTGGRVRLNGVVLLVGLGLLIALAARPAPRTAGIVEPTPIERTASRACEAVRARNGSRGRRPARARPRSALLTGASARAGMSRRLSRRLESVQTWTPYDPRLPSSRRASFPEERPHEGTRTR